MDHGSRSRHKDDKVGWRLLEILEAAGVEIDFIFIYVDDVRIGLKDLVPGVVYCSECEAFKICPIQAAQDTGLKPSQITARVLNDVMNSIAPDLKFTTETVHDFESGMLPTLDISCGWSQCSLSLSHSPMNPSSTQHPVSRMPATG